MFADELLTEIKGPANSFSPGVVTSVLAALMHLAVQDEITVLGEPARSDLLKWSKSAKRNYPLIAEALHAFAEERYIDASYWPDA